MAELEAFGITMQCDSAITVLSESPAHLFDLLVLLISLVTFEFQKQSSALLSSVRLE